MTLFWVHMVEHLLLIMVIPALLVTGHPLSALRAAAMAYGKQGAIDSFARSTPVAVVTHPGVGLALYSAVIVGTHLTGFMDAMAQHPWLMGAEQWLYLLTGYVYFLPLLGAEPIRWKLPYLARPALIIFGMTPDTVVGIVLMQTSYAMFPLMQAGHPGWAPGALRDQYLAGAVMWVAGDGLMMLFGVGVALAIITHSASDNILGRRLEAIRRHTLNEHLVSSGEAVQLDADIDVDSDEAALEAYNKMLTRMSSQEG
jgi:putative copper resistance protein D